MASVVLWLLLGQFVKSIRLTSCSEQTLVTEALSRIKKLSGLPCVILDYSEILDQPVSALDAVLWMMLSLAWKGSIAFKNKV